MDLFGWGKFDIPISADMTYTMFQHQGQNVAALSVAAPEALEQNIPSHWSCYVAVDDVDALLTVVTDNGGQIIYGPMDVFDSGRMAFLMDPTGAALGLWQARSHIGAGIVNTVGAMCWNELLTRNPETAKAFYSAVRCWDSTAMNIDHPHQQSRGRNNGGMIEMDESFGEYAACWMPLFQHRRNQGGHRARQRTRGQVHNRDPNEARNRLLGAGDRPGRRALLYHGAIQRRPLGRIDGACKSGKGSRGLTSGVYAHLIYRPHILEKLHVQRNEISARNLLLGR